MKMSMFGKMGDMYRLQKEAKKIKKELAKLHIWSESNGVKVTVNGEMEVLEVEISPEADHKAIAKGVKEATNKAVKKAQTMSAEKMKSVMGGLQGLMGGQ